MNPLALLNTATAPARNAVLRRGEQFLRNQIAGAVRNTGLSTYRTLQTGAPLPAALSSVKLSANTPVFRGTTIGLSSLAAGEASNKSGFTGQIEETLNKVGPALDQLFSGTPQAIQQFGAEQEKKGWGGALEMASPFGFLAAPFIPNSATATPAPVKPRPIAGLPADYKKTELQAGAAAEAFRPGAGLPGQQQAPEIPGTSMGNMAGLYEQGRSAAKTQEEMNMVRDLGLAMHAQKYGTPGQRMASTIGARNPLLDRMGLQQPSRPEVFVENPTDAFLQSEVDKKEKEVQDFLKAFNASRSTK